MNIAVINIWQVDREMIAAAMQDQLNQYPAMKTCECFFLWSYLENLFQLLAI